MIARHAEHTFDLDAIAPGEWVLDIGCRGFEIPKLLASRGINVIAIDGDPSVVPPENPFIHYTNAVVVHRELAANKRLTFWIHPTDKQAHSLIGNQGTPIQVQTLSIDDCLEAASLAGGKDVASFALIKMDCEGAEYALMRDIVDAAYAGQFWAKQISVEYHDHCGKNPEADMDAWYSRLHARSDQFYKRVKFERERPPWGGSPHYVDCLYQRVGTD